MFPHGTSLRLAPRAQDKSVSSILFAKASLSQGVEGEGGGHAGVEGVHVSGLGDGADVGGAHLDELSHAGVFAADDEEELLRTGGGDLLLVQKNYKFYRNFSSNWIDLSYLYTVHTNNYLNLPVMAQLRWGKNLHLMAQGGFYLGGWLTAHREGESFSLDDLAYGDRQNSHFDEAIEFNPSRDNRFDAGWAYGFGAGFTIKKIDVSLEARWYYALTDTQKNYMLFLNHRYNTTFALQGGVSIQL